MSKIKEEDCDTSDTSIISSDDEEEEDYYSIENILYRAEAAEEECEQFYYKMLDADIQVHWELPELHKVCRYFTRCPKPDVLKEIEDRGLPFRKGVFDKLENKRIMKNWRRFCKEYQLPNNPCLLTLWRGRKKTQKLQIIRRNAILWLCKGLNDRIPYQVYKSFSCFGVKNGSLDEKELRIVQTIIDNHRPHRNSHLLSTICVVLGRNIENMIKLKVSSIREPDYQYTRQSFTFEFMQDFFKKLCGIMKNKYSVENFSFMFLRDHVIEHSVWVELSKAMQISPTQVRSFWERKAYIQLFTEEPVYLDELKRRILKLLYKRKYQCWTHIKWRKVAKKFSYFTSAFVSHKFYSLYRRHFTKFRSQDCSEAINKLYEMYVEKDYALKRKRLIRYTVDDDLNLTPLKIPSKYALES